MHDVFIETTTLSQVDKIEINETPVSSLEVVTWEGWKPMERVTPDRER